MTVVVVPTASGSTENSDHMATTSAKVMVNADTIFTAVGAVTITSLWSECITLNGATASTLQYQITPTVGTATTISGASASLANATAGTIVTMDGAALATAPTLSATGVGLNTTSRGTIFKPGTLTTVIGVGSTTGTWRHYVRYEPLEPGAYVIPAF